MATTSLYDAVLAPLDGSRIAAQAVPPAATFAREAGCVLVLLHVLTKEEPQDGRASYEDAELERRVRRSQMEAYLEGLRRSLGDYQVSIDVRILEGDVAHTILEEAHRLGHVMLVLTESGMSAAMTCGERHRAGQVHAQIVSEWKGPLLVLNR